MSALLAIALFGRDPEVIPHLRKKAWQRWAAAAYRQSATVACILPVPSDPVHPANDAFRSTASRKLKTLCGALSARADALGHKDLAQTWADRFWEGYELDASEQEIQAEYDALVERELAFRALLR